VESSAALLQPQTLEVAIVNHKAGVPRLLAVTALSIGLFFALVPAQTATISAGEPSQKAPAPLDARWQIGAAVLFGNMTVFPVTSQRAFNGARFITLEEGIRSGTVLVRERGANGRLRRVGQQRDSDDADVNQLTIINRSGKTLVLIAGEMFAGGKQDRIVAQDCLIASSRKPVTIEVFCVERDRWGEQTSFGRNRTTQRPSGERTDQVRGNLKDDVALAFTMLPGLASPNVREKAQTSKEQTVVWAEVDKTNGENYVSSRTNTLSAVFEDRSVSRKLESYQQAFRMVTHDPRVVGVVIAVGGRIRSADVFLNNSLFAKYWPKLLKSGALEAMNISAAVADESVSRENAAAFLARVAGKRSTAGRKQVYDLVEHQSDGDASFELIGTGSSGAPLVHFNRFAKED
jgi:hypothetical protein